MNLDGVAYEPEHTYRAVFHIVKPKNYFLDSIVENLWQADYVKVYNRYCELSNEAIPGINKDYDDKVSNGEEVDYEEYFYERMKPIAAEAKKISHMSELFDYYPKTVSGEYIGLVSKAVFNGAEMYFTLE